MNRVETDLLPCPFCGSELYRKKGSINPAAYCKTEDCYGAKMPVVNLDVPSDVAAWNRRSTPIPAGSAEATEALAYQFQNIMAQKLEVDKDGDIAGVGPASFAMARAASPFRRQSRAATSQMARSFEPRLHRDPEEEDVMTERSEP